MQQFLKTIGLATVLGLGLAQNSLAQGKFTTAAEVRPILTATKNNWLAVREYDGQDLLYFTHLLSWRCGLTSIQYAINSDIPVLPWPFVPCDETAANPAALPDNQQIYASFALQSIYFVTVKINYDDGTSDQMMFKRQDILQ